VKRSPAIFVIVGRYSARATRFTVTGISMRSTERISRLPPAVGDDEELFQRTLTLPQIASDTRSAGAWLLTAGSARQLDTRNRTAVFLLRVLVEPARFLRTLAAFHSSLEDTRSQ